jgi:hypothetical protein
VSGIVANHEYYDYIGVDLNEVLSPQKYLLSKHQSQSTSQIKEKFQILLFLIQTSVLAKSRE